MAEKRTAVRVKQEDDAYPVASSEGEKDGPNTSQKRRRIKHEPPDENHVRVKQEQDSNEQRQPCPRYSHQSNFFDEAAEGALEEIKRNLASNREMLKRAERFITETVARLKSGAEIWNRMPETHGALQEVLIWRAMKAASTEQAPAAAQNNNRFTGAPSRLPEGAQHASIKQHEHDVEAAATVVINKIRKERKDGNEVAIQAAEAYVWQQISALKKGQKPWKKIPQSQKRPRE